MSERWTATRWGKQAFSYAQYGYGRFCKHSPQADADFAANQALARGTLNNQVVIDVQRGMNR